MLVSTLVKAFEIYTYIDKINHLIVVLGYGEHYNHSIIFGDLKSLKFCVLYKRGWKILAGCTCNCDPIAARLSFDIQDNVRYDDSFPSYITDVFPATPILGTDLFI
jgi:hypothetical protein